MRRYVGLLSVAVLTMMLVSCGFGESNEPKRIKLGDDSTGPTASAKPPSNWDITITDIQDYPKGEKVVTLNNNLSFSVYVEQEDKFTWPYTKEDGQRQSVFEFADEGFQVGLKQLILDGKTGQSTQPLEITNIEFRPYKSDNFRGFADVQLNGVLTVQGLTLHETDRFWIGWPAIQDKFGRYKDQVTMKNELKETLVERLTKQYQESQESEKS